jgi:hypothetical protein
MGYFECTMRKKICERMLGTKIDHSLEFFAHSSILSTIIHSDYRTVSHYPTRQTVRKLMSI